MLPCLPEEVFPRASPPDSRGVEGESPRTPGHAAEMPLFATNPFDQDVGKRPCRSLATPRGSACPPWARVPDPPAAARCFAFPEAPS